MLSEIVSGFMLYFDFILFILHFDFHTFFVNKTDKIMKKNVKVEIHAPTKDLQQKRKMSSYVFLGTLSMTR